MGRNYISNKYKNGMTEFLLRNLYIQFWHKNGTEFKMATNIQRLD